MKGYDEALKRIQEGRSGTVLDLSGLGLTTLPPEIGQLANLALLNLSENQFTALPLAITQLTNIKTLDLHKNQLNTLPPEIAKLSKLTLLLLDDNHLTTLPPEIAQLTELAVLFLSRNQLTTLPLGIVQLAKLDELFLRSNQLTTLPVELWQRSLGKLFLDKNPLVSPPMEIVEQGREAVLAYFGQSGPTRSLSEVKIVLVGHGAAGKTSLVKRLTTDSFDPNEDQTHGINICHYAVPLASGEVKARIWDFGGQEIMHATHRFFLSRRSLFVVVLDGRRDEDPEYWLNHARTYSSDAPVLVVLNKADKEHHSLDSKSLREKFPQICGFYRTSCLNGSGIDELKQAIATQVAQIPMIHTHWPESWIKVKQTFETNPQPYLSRAEFSQVCQASGITFRTQQKVLVNFLNDLGIAIHFDGLHMDDLHVLNPSWATNGVYRILNHPQAAEAKGLISTDMDTLSQLLAAVHEDQKQANFDYPRDKHGFLVALMKKFELCLEVDEPGKILFPDLLQKESPDFAFDYEAATKFRCSYGDFMPPTVMPRLMVKRHRDIEDALRWHAGMVTRAKASDARAFIKADKTRRELQIWIEGTSRREYLAALRETLAEIHSDFPSLHVSQQIGCPCTACRNEKTPHFHDYENVLRFYLNGLTDLPCPILGNLVPITLILEGVFGGQVKLLEEIRDDLKAMKHKGEIEEKVLDKLKKLGIKLGIGPISFDLVNAIEMLFKRK